MNLALRQAIVHFPFVVAAVAVERSHGLLYLRQQFRHRVGIMAVVLRQDFGDNLPCIGIDRQVQIAPRPPLRFPVTPHLPFPFAEHLQAGAVDPHFEMVQLIAEVEHDVQLGRPLGERRTIGDRHVGEQQGNQRAAKTFGLSIRQFQQLTYGQQAQLPGPCRQTDGQPSVPHSHACIFPILRC